MSDQHPDPPSEQITESLEDPNIKLARRRRLIKGLVAGMPAVITLANGRLVAAASNYAQNNLLTCLQNRPNIEQTATSRTRCEASNPTNTNKFMYASEATHFSADLDGGGTNSYCILYYKSGGVAPINAVEALADDGDGTNFFGAATTADGPPKAGFYAMTHTCWSSFLG
ncbi:MAG: hypothetical protein H7832_01585 [Magnetococcus sp. DMHC-6]